MSKEGLLHLKSLYSVVFMLLEDHSGCSAMITLQGTKSKSRISSQKANQVRNDGEFKEDGISGYEVK